VSLRFLCARSLHYLGILLGFRAHITFGTERHRTFRTGMPVQSVIVFQTHSSCQLLENLENLENFRS